MHQDHKTRITGVVQDQLAKEKLIGEDAWCEVSFGLVLFQPQGPDGQPVPNVQPQILLGWNVLVSLKTNLLGHPDYALAAPIPMPLPPDQMFRQAASMLLAAVRQKKEQEESIPVGVPKQ